jgi:hypothetical protein
MGAISLKYKSKSGNLTAPGDVDPGAMIPIATQYVSASSVSTLTFSNIPQNYEHLQVRIFSRSTRGYTGNAIDGITIQSNLGYLGNSHYLLGDGGSVSAGTSYPLIFFPDDGGALSGNYGSGIVDILDYSNTNKNKTLRALIGFDNNSGSLNGTIAVNSGFWNSTSAITSLTFSYAYGGDIKQYSHIALYGIKRAGA